MSNTDTTIHEDGSETTREGLCVSSEMCHDTPLAGLRVVCNTRDGRVRYGDAYHTPFENFGHDVPDDCPVCMSGFTLQLSAEEKDEVVSAISDRIKTLTFAIKKSALSDEKLRVRYREQLDILFGLYKNLTGTDYVFYSYPS